MALVVLLGVLACAAPSGGNSSAAWTQRFYLASNGTAPFALSTVEPVSNASVDIGVNGSAEFTVTNVSGILNRTDGLFHLNVGLVSLNVSGIELNITLFVDWNGSGAQYTVALGKYSTTIAKEAEFPSFVASPPIQSLQDLRGGTLRLVLNRTDTLDAWVRVLCGGNAIDSVLTVPYSVPLVADAGSNRSTNKNVPVTFDSSRSRVLDPGNTTYEWFLETNGTVVNLTGKQVVYSYPLGGRYNATLRLTWRGVHSSDTIIVNVTGNKPPTAEAGLDISSQRRGRLISFHGEGNDSDGIIVSYSWAFGDGTGAAGQGVNHTYNMSGNFTVTLTVTDDGGLTASDTLRVHINYPPTVTASVQSRTGRTVTFRANATDRDNPVLSYRWDFGDGQFYSGVTAVHTFATTGLYFVSVNVSDDLGENATDDLTVDISASGPSIISISSRSEAAVGDEVKFTASVSNPDGGTLTYQWNFGDGGSSFDVSPSHRYTKNGKFKVVLVVSDSFGNHVVDDKDMTITETSGSDSSGYGLAIGCAVLGIVVLLVAVYVMLRMKPGERTPMAPPGGYQPQTAYGPPGYGQAAPGPGPSAGYGFTKFAGTPGALAPGGMWGGELRVTPPASAGGGFTPSPAVPRAPRPRRAAATTPGVCPRCGSTNLQRFEDGHAKCMDCRKILFNE